MSANPTTAAWVRFLRNYGPIPTNDNMYDESIQRALRRHKIRPITLPAPVRDRLVDMFKGDEPRSHILTGTAGDGKTYHCREVWTELGGDVAAWNHNEKVQRLAIGERTLVIVKDLSELLSNESDDLIAELARNVADPSGQIFYLLAANHGQLLEKLKSAPRTPEVIRVGKVIEDLMVGGTTTDKGIAIDLTDLSRTPAADMAMAIIDEVTAHEGWGGCENCDAKENGGCPIFENRRRLIGVDPQDPFKRRLKALIELSERNGSHFPVRQLLSLVANAILGHPQARDGLMSCSDVAAIQAAGMAHLASIYSNVFGENLKPSRAEKTEQFRKLNVFGIGAETSNRVDTLLVYGADDPAYAADYADLVLTRLIHDGPAVGYSAPALPLGA